MRKKIARVGTNEFNDENNRILELYNEGRIIKEIISILNFSPQLITRRLNYLNISKKERVCRGLKYGAKNIYLPTGAIIGAFIDSVWRKNR